MAPPVPPAAVTAFDGLLALRAQLGTNKRDAATHFVNFCASNVAQSSSQLFQDLLVLFFLDGKKNGFFVEFGATNGIDASNTFLLERALGWKGILAEPARCWHTALKANRKALIDLHCVWRETGQKLEFKETTIPELSTLNELIEKDYNREGRKIGTTYTVDTISLNDLLSLHDSPKNIDYLSIDTEGSEFEILNRFDFRKYDVSIMTVEHNYCDPDRKNIHDLLSANGFVRMFDFLSKFDDWYVKRSIVGING